MSRDHTNLIWIDLETTGLRVGNRVILEIASIITDKDLHILEEGPVLAIYHPDEVLDRIDAWPARQHEYSGLLDACRNSDISVQEAEQQTLRFLRKYTPRQASPLCGNSISLDRRFLMRYMPELYGHLSHRSVDVSSIAELVYRWYPGIMSRLDKDATHRASDDIRGSIEELREYRRQVFRL